MAHKRSTIRATKRQLPRMYWWASDGLQEHRQTARPTNRRVSDDQDNLASTASPNIILCHPNLLHRKINFAMLSHKKTLGRQIKKPQPSTRQEPEASNPYLKKKKFNSLSRLDCHHIRSKTSRRLVLLKRPRLLSNALTGFENRCEMAQKIQHDEPGAEQEHPTAIEGTLEPTVLVKSEHRSRIGT